MVFTGTRLNNHYSHEPFSPFPLWIPFTSRLSLVSSSPFHFVNVDHKLFKTVSGGQYRMETEHCLSDSSFVYRLYLLPESHGMCEKMGLAVTALQLFIIFNTTSGCHPEFRETWFAYCGNNFKMHLFYYSYGNSFADFCLFLEGFGL